jgi:adenylate cyclase
LPERAQAVILYTETRGFTRRSAILEPAVVLERISEFFALVTTAVRAHDATMLSVLNDTLVATFTGPGDARHAVEAAQEIQRGFASLAEAWDQDYGFGAAVAMGIHRGETVVGFASGGLPDQLLIFGDSVSVAERLLHRARAGEFVLSKAVVDELVASGFALEVQQLPSLQLPRREPIGLYGVLLDTRLDFT